jgi:hypothetical protein
VWVSIALAALVVGVPLLLALGGTDVLVARNVSPAFVPIIIAVAAGMTVPQRVRAGAVMGLLILSISLGIDLATAGEPKFGSEDWRGAARAADESRLTRAIVLTPEGGEAIFRYYSPDATTMPAVGRNVREIVEVGLPASSHGIGESPSPPRPESPQPPILGFRLVEYRRATTFTLVRFVSRVPRRVTPGELSRSILGSSQPSILLEPRKPARRTGHR